MPITEKTRKEDQRLREKLKRVDLGELKKAISSLLTGKKPAASAKRER